MRISMWWDGVWAGCRLDSGVCPIYKHTELDEVMLMRLRLLPQGFGNVIVLVLCRCAARCA